MFDSKIVDNAILDLNKAFGEGIINKVNDSTSIDIERISTGSLTVDIATGGGLPKGRIIELYGQESSGKTTLAIHCIVEAQKTGGACAMIDFEHSYDKKYAKTQFVDITTSSTKNNKTSNTKGSSYKTSNTKGSSYKNKYPP